METTKLHIILISSPGKGHLIPLIELGKCLVTSLGFRVTIFTVDNDIPLSSQSLQANDLQIIPLPRVDITTEINDPSTANIVTIFKVTMKLSLPNIQSAISKMASPPSVLIVDYFSTDCLTLALEFNMAKYVFAHVNAHALALTLYAPSLIKTGLNFPSKNNPAKIPGCQPIQFDDLFRVFEDPESRAYQDYVDIGSQMAKAEGIMTNTWDAFEPKTIKALRENDELKSIINHIPIYPIGPLVKSEEPLSPSRPESKVLDWLDKQPAESVLYISFGSLGNLSTQQQHELAWGLEMSQQRFLWVIRPPTNTGNINYLSQHGPKSLELDENTWYLPSGFSNRTREIGLLVPNWAPQSQILAHPSVGGFLSHSGWNSILESLVNGVPIIAWPLFGDQNIMAAILEENKVAIRAMKPSKGVVNRWEVEKIVRKIITSSEIRDRVKVVKESATIALSEDGSSNGSMLVLAKRWLGHSLQYQ